MARAMPLCRLQRRRHLHRAQHQGRRSVSGPGPLKTRRKRRARAKKVVLTPPATVQQYNSRAASHLPISPLPKALPIDFLQRCGVAEQTYDGAPAVRFPFYSTDGELLVDALPHRAPPATASAGRRVTKAVLYGQNHLAEASKRGTSIVIRRRRKRLVDAQTPHSISAHSHAWRQPSGTSSAPISHLLDGFEDILVIVEPDAGGEAVK